MCVCVSMWCLVLCVGRGLASGRSPIQGVLPIVYRFISKNPSTPQGKRGRLRKKEFLLKIVTSQEAIPNLGTTFLWWNGRGVGVHLMCSWWMRLQVCVLCRNGINRKVYNNWNSQVFDEYIFHYHDLPQVKFMLASEG
jgi:hypothetical protein